MGRWTLAPAFAGFLLALLVAAILGAGPKQGDVADVTLRLADGKAPPTRIATVEITERGRWGWTFAGTSPSGAEVYGGASCHSRQFAIVVWGTALKPALPTLWAVGWRQGRRMFLLYDFVSGTLFEGSWEWRR